MLFYIISNKTYSKVFLKNNNKIYELKTNILENRKIIIKKIMLKELLKVLKA